VATVGSSKEEMASEVDSSIFTIPFDPTIFGKTFQQSFKNLHSSSLLSDVSLILSENEKILGHKVILSSSSSKLKKMFENEDNKDYILTFDKGEEKEHFKMMILYIYTGKFTGSFFSDYPSSCNGP